MGRVIIRFLNGRLESFRCKSKERAEQIARKRPNAKEWNYYENNERIPPPKKNVTSREPTTFEELESLMKQEGLM